MRLLTSLHIGCSVLYMTSTQAPIPNVLHIGRRTYTVNPDGYCPTLDSYIIRMQDGRLATVPVGDDA